MPPAEKIRIQHMRDAASRACELAQGRTIEDLMDDDVLSLAVFKLIEIIGEAAKAITEETRARYPKIPWRLMAGTRDRLSHRYFDIEFDFVWEILTRDLPPLLPELERIAAELPDPYAE